MKTPSADPIPNPVGVPSRKPDLDALPGFRTPPPGYGQVGFFWWLGDALTKERLLYHLDQLTGMGTTALQVNYAHDDTGGFSWGLTFKSDPPLFSEPWWELFGWFMDEARRRGMSVSLSDYTLGTFGQEAFVDDALREDPGLAGATLQLHLHTVAGPSKIDWPLPPETISLIARQLVDGKPDTATHVDLTGYLVSNTLHWNPGPGDWQIAAVSVKRNPNSLDPANPRSGPAINRHFFDRFESRFPGQSGKGLNFFFSDELTFGLSGMLWNDAVAKEFINQKGYDLIPVAAALFMDIGPITPKARLDYADVMMELCERGYFRPVYQWHQDRGMIYGCDHGGRGRDVTEFGDYFRAMRWNQGPGCDQPNLGTDLIKNKVNSSIAHLYERPRVWLEGFYSSGWGTTPAQVAEAVFINFLHGHNLLTLHGLYYSTHGGWWEWAPPDNHWRMPYWRHMRPLMQCFERLSYLLSQGVHVCDVAVIYPVAAKEADAEGGKKSVDTSFDLVCAIYAAGMDVDFIDFQSIERAAISEGRLHVAGEAYRAIVVPAMRAVRHGMLEKLAAFAHAGGMVLVVGEVPESSDRVGRSDPRVTELVDTILDAGPGLLPDIAAAVKYLQRNIEPDMAFSVTPRAKLHRRIGPRDVYAMYGLPEGTVVDFRAVGRAESWDPWTGQIEPLPILEQDLGRTKLALPRGEHAIQIIVFSPNTEAEAIDAASIQFAPSHPTKSAVSRQDVIELDGPWECGIEPTMDNRYGDFHWPATPRMIGPEVRRVKWMAEPAGAGCERPDFDDGTWPTVTCGFGPIFMQLGPLPCDAKVDAPSISKLRNVDPADGWKPYDISWRLGVENDPGHQGYHGLKCKVHDEFIRLGKLVDRHNKYVREAEPEGTRYYLWSTVRAPEEIAAATLLVGGMPPAEMWLGGEKIEDWNRPVRLKAGTNPLLLRYDQPGSGYVVPCTVGPIPNKLPTGSLAMRWYGHSAVLPLDCRPTEAPSASWYRFDAPPGAQSMKFAGRGTLRAWCGGKELSGSRCDETWCYEFPPPNQRPAKIALRLEHLPGLYAGAAIPEPITFECGPGLIELGDWSALGGLASYSGGMWYRRRVSLSGAQAGQRIELELGHVAASAEVRINGISLGARVTHPWKFDLTAKAIPGINTLEILVFNTLANHYQTIPTRYRGEPTAGLFGPVRLRIGVDS